MWIRKDKAGSCGYRGGKVFEWGSNGDVIEVPDDLGESLLAIPGGGFSEADPPKKAAAKVTEPGDELASDDSDGEQAEQTARRRPGRPRKTPVEE